MLKVLHLLKTAVGASWALRQTTELVKLGVEVHLALPDGPMVARYKAAGVVVHIFDPSIVLKRPWNNIAKVKQLRSLVDEIKPDIIHSHFVATTLLMRLALRSHEIPRIFHVPGPLHLEHWGFRRAELASANRDDYWLASCLWTKNAYQTYGINVERVGLAYYGVNEDDFSFKPANDENLRAQLDLPQDTFLIAMVAYFYAPKAYLGQKRGLKGHEDLIDAIAIVRQHHPNVKCVFVGGPWAGADNYFTQVQGYAQQHAPDSCVFLGLRNDVPTLYPQFDLAVHPSHSENVGGAVESMYAGVATLTSNVGGFPDLVEDGVTGYMAPAKAPELLAKKIIQAIEQPQQRKKLVASASIRVANIMNVQHNAKQITDFYQQVLSQRTKRTVSSQQRNRNA
ncbi:MAG: glycosyltransferase [Paraglaciecola chathamensis]